MTLNITKYYVFQIYDILFWFWFSLSFGSDLSLFFFTMFMLSFISFVFHGYFKFYICIFYCFWCILRVDCVPFYESHYFCFHICDFLLDYEQNDVVMVIMCFTLYILLYYFKKYKFNSSCQLIYLNISRLFKVWF